MKNDAETGMTLFEEHQICGCMMKRRKFGGFR